jgi:hypothetical protein
MLREKEKQAKRKERETSKNFKIHQKMTHNRKLIEGMKAGLNPDISDDEKKDDENQVIQFSSPYSEYLRKRLFNFFLFIGSLGYKQNESLSSQGGQKLDNCCH